MTRKRDDKEHLPSPCASSEDEDLRIFCSKVRYHEISFEEWKAQHKKLDLQYPLRLSIALLKQSQKTVITLSRTITSCSASGRLTQIRERFQCEVEIPENIKDKTTLRFPGLGDRQGEDAGDLIVILQITD